VVAAPASVLLILAAVCLAIRCWCCDGLLDDFSGDLAESSVFVLRALLQSFDGVVGVAAHASNEDTARLVDDCAT
jgi:hypothetical protein